MRIAGASYQQIADALGYADPSGPYRAIEAELKKQRRERAREVVGLEPARLDALLAACWEKALDGEPRAVMNVLRISERRARMLGLDTRLSEIEGMTQEELTEYLLTH